MIYTKVTPQNAYELVIADSILVHTSNIIESYNNDSEFDFAIKVVQIIGSGAYIFVPGTADNLSWISSTPRFEIDFFTDGFWWQKTNSTS